MYNDGKKHRLQELGYVLSRRNIADHINELDKMLTDGESIVKSIIRDQGKAPCIILYSDEHLTDLKHLCCTETSILGVDKTFNLCNMHVTTTCYKQTTVVKDSTGEAPIFLGPMFIHDNSDYESFSNFFNHLRTKLSDTNTDQLVIGSDEEQSLVNAITKAFPQSTHILCTRHLLQNAKQKLIDDSVDKNDRESIISDIFGDNGLVNADDSICFDEKSSKIEEKTKDLSSKFNKYYLQKMKKILKEKVNKPITAGFVSKTWTNNNSESLNHALKQAIDWKSKPLLDLVKIISDIVATQFKDLRRALVSTGQYRLADTHRQFGVTRTVWVSKTDSERQRLYRRFRLHVPKDKNTVTSTDRTTTVIPPRILGKKIGQRKRNINERTTSFKKCKQNDD